MGDPPPAEDPRPPLPAASGTPHPRRRGGWRRFGRLAGALALLLLLALAGLWLSRERLLLPWLAERATGLAAEALGGRWELDGLHGDLFHRLELHGLRTVEPADRTPLRRLELDRLEVEWSLLDLLRRRPEAVRVRGRGLRLALDLRSPPPPADEAGGGFDRAAWTPPWWLPRLELGDAAVTLDGPDGLHLETTGAGLLFEPGAAGEPAFALHTDLRALAAAGGRLERGSLHADGRLAGGRLRARIEAAGVDAGAWATAAGLASRGEIAFTATAALPLAEPAAAVADLDLAGGALAVAGFDLDELAARLQLEDGELRAGEVRVRTPEGSARLDGLRLPLDPSLGPGGLLRAAEADLALDLPGLRALLGRGRVDLGAAPRLADELRLACRLQDGELVIGRGESSGADGGLAFAGARLTLADAGGALGAEGLRLPLTFRLERPWRTPDGTELPPCDGRAVLVLRSPLVQGRRGPVRAALEDLELRALDDSIRLLREARIELDPATGLEIAGLALATPAGTLELDATLPLAPGAAEPLAEGPLAAHARLRGFDWARIEPLLGPAVAARLPAAAGKAELEATLAGSWGAPELELTLDGQDWRLREPPAGAPEGPFAFGLELRAAGGKAELEQGWLRGPGASLAAAGELELPLDLRAWRGGATPAAGAAAAELSLDITDPAWLAALPAEVRPAAEGGPVQLELRARQAAGRLEIERLRLDARGLALTAAGGLPLARDPAAPLADGPLDLRLDLGPLALERLPVEPELRGELSAHLVLGGDWNAPELSGTLAGSGLRALLPEADRQPAAAELEARLSWRDGSLAVPELRLRSEELELDAGGALALPLAPRALLAGEVPGPGPLAAHAELRVPDLSWAGELPGLVRAGGAATLRLGLNGPLDRLEPAGDLRLEDVSLRLASPGAPALSALTLSGRFDAERLSLDHARGELGAEPFRLAGEVRYGAGAPPELDLRLKGKDLLFWRAQGVKLRADADLAVTGPLAAATVSGRVRVGDARLVRNVDFLRLPVGAPAPPRPGGIQLFSLAPPLDRLAFDVAVESDEDGMLLRNNVARGRLRPELRLGGTGAVPVLTGEVYLDEAILNLPATRLDLDQGVVRFLPNDPFRPRLNLRGGMRRYGYDVQMLVTGPYDRSEVVLSSTPPLSQEELLVLVTTGQPPAERIDAQGAMSSVAVYLAQDLLRSLFGDESTEAEESLLDRLEIYTGRDTTRQGEDTIEGRLRLLDGWLFADDSLYLESEKDSYGDFNVGLKLVIRYP
ncbi:MAG: hypothetical protein D6702_12420 [Planctomycetota bacterium]|nr:MAG: hypothetical protein D6702_12420 [Planctomycetota bacterium]